VTVSHQKLAEASDYPTMRVCFRGGGFGRGYHISSAVFSVFRINFPPTRISIESLARPAPHQRGCSRSSR